MDTSDTAARVYAVFLNGTQLPLMINPSPNNDMPSIQRGAVSLEGNDKGIFLGAEVVFTEEQYHVLRKAADIKYQGQPEAIIQDFIASAALSAALEVLALHAAGQRFYPPMTQSYQREQGCFAASVETDAGSDTVAQTALQHEAIQVSINSIKLQLEDSSDDTEVRIEIPQAFQDVTFQELERFAQEHPGAAEDDNV